MKINNVVLIVEDNIVSIRIIKAMLQKIGITSDSVTNGKQAIASWKEKKFDLILMDCQMPIMDGYRATAEIRSIEKQQSIKAIPIIAFTAGEIQSERQECFDAGMNDFLAKPIDFDALKTIIQKWLQTKDNTDKNDIQLHVTTSNNQSNPIIDEVKMIQLRELLGAGLKELLNLFITTNLEKLKQLQQASDEMDVNQLLRLAHGLKGSSGNIGALYIMQLSEKIEQLIKLGELDGIEQIISELVIAFTKTREELSSIVENA